MEINIKSTAKTIAQAIEKAIKQATPITKKTLKKELSTIEKKAKAGWPIRQKKYGESKGSKDKLSTDLKSSGAIVNGSISNSAQYAWAIKAASKSNSSVPAGRRVADELLYKPMKKAADKIAKQVANELINNIKRA